ncbi:hypothetical protein [Mesorhizobium sp. 1B3]|uniref:hypothetical protein n=1 Tax=Mesorhizobium sp. 1B3 TaxID=3243599 RepID=UPI003D97E1AB
MKIAPRQVSIHIRRLSVEPAVSSAFQPNTALLDLQAAVNRALSGESTAADGSVHAQIAERIAGRIRAEIGGVDAASVNGGGR